MRLRVLPPSGAADDSIVLANFNQLWKISPEFMGIWARALRAHPKAVAALLPVVKKCKDDDLRAKAKGLAKSESYRIATRLAEELEALILKEGPDTIGGFIAEPIQGAGGVIVPPPTYFEKIQPILKKYDILFIADEVITGFGRTGNLFGSQTFKLEPDLLTTAKMITSAYVPLSALYVSGKIYQACADASASLGVFGHGYTYSGHPLGCAVALETLKIYEERQIVEHVRAMTPVFQQGLQAFAGHPLIGDVRGVGLIGAVELAEDRAARKPFDAKRGVGAYLVRRAQEHGLILRVMGGDIIAFSPPLIITEAQITEMMTRFARALDDTASWLKGV